MKKVKIIINGMHCASCASNVERSLKKIQGVKEVNVSVIGKKAFVEIDEKTSQEDLKKAVAKEANIALKPGDEPIEFYLSEPRNISAGKLHVLQYKKDALLGNNQYQVFAIMSINDVVWLNYIFRNEIYGYLF